MGQIIDRLGNLIKSSFQDLGLDDLFDDQKFDAYNDDDLKSAWEELEGFMNSDHTSSQAGAGTQGSTYTPPKQGIPEELRQDYANLEVSFGAPFDDVTKSYKELIRKFHPDRFANDPEKQKTATEIAQKVNQSYHRIKEYKNTGKI